MGQGLEKEVWTRQRFLFHKRRLHAERNESVDRKKSDDAREKAIYVWSNAFESGS